MVQINQKIIGEREPVFIVFEAGPTHTGLESAMKLVDVAVEAGADAVKFQLADVDRLMGNKEVMFSYEALTKEGQTEEVREPLYDILKRREMPLSDWRTLIKYCNDKKIIFFSTAVFEEEVDFLVDELGVTSLKLASADINHLPLIEYMAKKQVNIQLDTGNADLWEIERAVIAIESQGNQNIIIHLCPTGYPAYLESINLRMIPTLKQLFPKYAIAFSDHTPGWEMDIAAIALGANLVEKTITLDRTTRSCEHIFSIEPHEARRFVESIRNLEIALGASRRTIPILEKEKRKSIRRSMFAKSDLTAGTKVKFSDVEFRRPGTGIMADESQYVLGKTLKQNIRKGTQIQWEDLQ